MTHSSGAQPFWFWLERMISIAMLIRLQSHSLRSVSRRRATGLLSVTPSGVGFGVRFALDVGLALAEDAQGS